MITIYSVFKGYTQSELKAAYDSHELNAMYDRKQLNNLKQSYL